MAATELPQIAQTTPDIPTELLRIAEDLEREAADMEMRS
jgi:hypothetical protein